MFSNRSRAKPPPGAEQPKGHHSHQGEHRVDEEVVVKEDRPDHRYVAQQRDLVWRQDAHIVEIRIAHQDLRSKE